MSQFQGETNLPQSNEKTNLSIVNSVPISSSAIHDEINNRLKKEKIWNLMKFRSMDGNLDKICSDVNEANKKLKHSKSIFHGSTLCINPGQVGFRLSRKTKRDQDSNDRSFLGINLIRQTAEVRLIALNELLLSLKNGSTPEKSQKWIAKHLRSLRASICGDKIEKVLNDKEFSSLIDAMIKSGFISTLLLTLPQMEFEDRKIASSIFCNLFWRSYSQIAVVRYLEQNPKLLYSLIDGYRYQPVALTCGRMLRECVRYESLAKAILYSDYFYEIFYFLKTSSFEVSSDAFLSLQAVMIEHRKQTSEYLKDQYSQFFSFYDELLTCDNYVTQLSSLKFLGMLLLDRSFYDVMKRYVKESSNLKRVILLMTSSATNIQLEAFHLFKIFLANPSPSNQVKSIFVKNNERLLRVLSMIDGEKYGEQFSEEMAYLKKQLRCIDKESRSSGGSTDSTDDNDSNA